jgi:hypothetical protein
VIKKIMKMQYFRISNMVSVNKISMRQEIASLTIVSRFESQDVTIAYFVEKR